MSSEKLKDVLKAFIDTPTADIQAVVDALEAAAPQQQERQQPGKQLIPLLAILYSSVLGDTR